MDNVDNFLPAEHFDHEPETAVLMPPLPDATRLLVACHPADFSASALARAIEDTNAHLVNLNVTARRMPDGRLTVELRTNRRNPSAVARSLERYGYEVVALDDVAPADDDDEMRSRAAELLHILEM